MCDADFTLKKCTRCKELKPKIEFQKNRSKTDGLGTECKPCIKAYLASWYERNQEKQKAKNRENYEENKQAYVERAKAWAKKNPEKDKARRLKYSLENREEILRKAREKHAANPEPERERSRKRRKDNPEKELERVRARQAQKRRAMPAWADREKMKEIYAERRRVSEETGVIHHVDHIVPLVSKIVCGLHVPANLRIITAAENQAKCNKLLPQDIAWTT